MNEYKRTMVCVTIYYTFSIHYLIINYLYMCIRDGQL